HSLRMPRPRRTQSRQRPRNRWAANSSERSRAPSYGQVTVWDRSFAARILDRSRSSKARAEGEEMTSRYISTFVAILVCVLVATALIGWFSMSANEFLLAGG